MVSRADPFPVAPLIDNTTLPKPLLLRLDEPASISVNITGHPKPAVRWQIGRKRIKDSNKYTIESDGKTGHSLLITKVSEDLDSGVWVMATNDLGEDCCLIDVKTSLQSPNGEQRVKSKRIKDPSSTGEMERRNSSTVRKKRVRKVGDHQSVTSLYTWHTTPTDEVENQEVKTKKKTRMLSVDNLASNDSSQVGGASTRRTRPPPPDLNQSYDGTGITVVKKRSASKSSKRSASKSSLPTHDTSVDDIFMGTDQFATQDPSAKSKESSEVLPPSSLPPAHPSEEAQQQEDADFIRGSVRSRKSSRSRVKKKPTGSRASSVSSIGTTAELTAALPDRGVRIGHSPPTFGRGVVTSTPMSGISKLETSFDDDTGPRTEVIPSRAKSTSPSSKNRASTAKKRSKSASKELDHSNSTTNDLNITTTTAKDLDVPTTDVKDIDPEEPQQFLRKSVRGSKTGKKKSKSRNTSSENISVEPGVENVEVEVLQPVEVTAPPIPEQNQEKIEQNNEDTAIQDNAEGTITSKQKTRKSIRSRSGSKSRKRAEENNKTNQEESTAVTEIPPGTDFVQDSSVSVANEQKSESNKGLGSLIDDQDTDALWELLGTKLSVICQALLKSSNKKIVLVDSVQTIDNTVDILQEKSSLSVQPSKAVDLDSEEFNKMPVIVSKPKYKLDNLPTAIVSKTEKNLDENITEQNILKPSKADKKINEKNTIDDVLNEANKQSSLSKNQPSSTFKDQRESATAQRIVTDIDDLLDSQKNIQDQIIDDFIKQSPVSNKQASVAVHDNAPKAATKRNSSEVDPLQVLVSPSQEDFEPSDDDQLYVNQSEFEPSLDKLVHVNEDTSDVTMDELLYVNQEEFEKNENDFNYINKAEFDLHQTNKKPLVYPEDLNKNVKKEISEKLEADSKNVREKRPVTTILTKPNKLNISNANEESLQLNKPIEPDRNLSETRKELKTPNIGKGNVSSENKSKEAETIQSRTAPVEQNPLKSNVSKPLAGLDDIPLIDSMNEDKSVRISQLPKQNSLQESNVNVEKPDKGLRAKSPVTPNSFVAKDIETNRERRAKFLEQLRKEVVAPTPSSQDPGQKASAQDINVPKAPLASLPPPSSKSHTFSAQADLANEIESLPSSQTNKLNESTLYSNKQEPQAVPDSPSSVEIRHRSSSAGRNTGRPRRGSDRLNRSLVLVDIDINNANQVLHRSSSGQVYPFHGRADSPGSPGSPSRPWSRYGRSSLKPAKSEDFLLRKSPSQTSLSSDGGRRSVWIRSAKSAEYLPGADDSFGSGSSGMGRRSMSREWGVVTTTTQEEIIIVSKPNVQSAVKSVPVKSVDVKQSTEAPIKTDKSDKEESVKASSGKTFPLVKPQIPLKPVIGQATELPESRVVIRNADSNVPTKEQKERPKSSEIATQTDKSSLSQNINKFGTQFAGGIPRYQSSSTKPSPIMASDPKSIPKQESSKQSTTEKKTAVPISTQTNLLEMKALSLSQTLRLNETLTLIPQSSTPNKPDVELPPAALPSTTTVSYSFKSNMPTNIPMKSPVVTKQNASAQVAVEAKDTVSRSSSPQQAKLQKGTEFGEYLSSMAKFRSVSPALSGKSPNAELKKPATPVKQTISTQTDPRDSLKPASASEVIGKPSPPLGHQTWINTVVGKKVFDPVTAVLDSSRVVNNANLNTSLLQQPKETQSSTRGKTSPSMSDTTTSALSRTTEIKTQTVSFSSTATTKSTAVPIATQTESLQTEQVIIAGRKLPATPISTQTDDSFEVLMKQNTKPVEKSSTIPVSLQPLPKSLAIPISTQTEDITAVKPNTQQTTQKITAIPIATQTEDIKESQEKKVNVIVRSSKSVSIETQTEGITDSSSVQKPLIDSTVIPTAKQTNIEPIVVKFQERVTVSASAPIATQTDDFEQYLASLRNAGPVSSSVQTEATTEHKEEDQIKSSPRSVSSQIDESDVVILSIAVPTQKLQAIPIQTQTEPNTRSQTTLRESTSSSQSVQTDTPDGPPPRADLGLLLVDVGERTVHTREETITITQPVPKSSSESTQTLLLVNSASLPPRSPTSTKSMETNRIPNSRSNSSLSSTDSITRMEVKENKTKLERFDMTPSSLNIKHTNQISPIVLHEYGEVIQCKSPKSRTIDSRISRLLSLAAAKDYEMDPVVIRLLAESRERRAQRATDSWEKGGREFPPSEVERELAELVGDRRAIQADDINRKVRELIQSNLLSRGSSAEYDETFSFNITQSPDSTQLRPTSLDPFGEGSRPGSRGTDRSPTRWGSLQEDQHQAILIPDEHFDDSVFADSGRKQNLINFESHYNINPNSSVEHFSNLSNDTHTKQSSSLGQPKHEKKYSDEYPDKMSDNKTVQRCS